MEKCKKSGSVWSDERSRMNPLRERMLQDAEVDAKESKPTMTVVISGAFHVLRLGPYVKNNNKCTNNL